LPRILRPGIILSIALSFCFVTKAQYLSFRHLGVDEGMPSNVTSHACFDSTGLIWISTYNGLIGYDGTRMHQYLSETHPGLAIDVIDHLYCDSHNRIWISSAQGLSLLDEHRRMRKVTISDTIKNKDINETIEVPGLGILAFGPGYTYLLPENKTTWEKFTWFDKTVLKGGHISRIWRFNKTSCMLLGNKKVIVVDFATKKIITEIEVKGATTLSKLNDNELMAISTGKLELTRINVSNGTITKRYTDLKDPLGNPIRTQVISSDIAANGIIYITTRSAGLIAFDPVNEKIYSYTHHPLIKNSISSNSIRRVHCHRNGYMIITSITGLNFTNVLMPVLEQQNKFVDERGNIIDNITMAGEDSNGRIWIGNVNSLLIWDPLSNRIKNISPPAESISQEIANADAANIFRDKRNNMWVSYNGKGLAKFNSNGNMLTFLDKEKDHLPTNRIRIIRQLDNNMLMMGAEDGFFLMDPETFAIDSLTNHPLLKAIRKKRVVNIMPDGDDVWIASSTNGAAYCYNFKTKTLKTYTEKNGLSSDRVYCIAKDLYKNIYIGTYDGLNILSPDGKLRIIGKRNGLHHIRVDNLIADREGRIWITNFNTLICYTPADSSFAYFDEQNGVSNAGFTIGQAVLTKDGKLLFCNNGLLIADTKKPLNQQPFSPGVIINRIYDDGGYDLLDPSVTIKLKHDEGKISLYYLANTLIAANRFFYRYKMDGLDTGWQQPTKNNQVTYNLKTGNYVFHIQTSYNEGDWKENNNKITIIVMPPWWQTWWFRILMFAVVATALYLLYRSRVKTIKTKAAIKQQMTELEGKALRAQMNPHFIFNSLNAIQELIVTKKVEEGYQYLSNFSKLLRQVLNNSEKNTIPLSSEIEMIKLQLSLESLRFKNTFNYSIIVEKNIEPEMINIPPLLLQPYVENAVWHGLRHKDGERNLWIGIQEANDKLRIEIKDNGVGRQRAAEIKKQKLGTEQFESKGSTLSGQRIKLLNQQYAEMATVEYIDMKNGSDKASGTKVVINLPLNLK
jgi:ligand-binding sensor domain-containing protein